MLLTERRFALSRNYYVRARVNKTKANPMSSNVKVKPCSTFTFRRHLSYNARFILFTPVKITRQWKFTFNQKNVSEFLLYFLPHKFTHLNNSIINPTLTFSDCLPCQSLSYFFPPLPRLFPFSRFLLLFWATLRRKELWCHGECVWRVQLLSRQAPKEVTQTQPLTYIIRLTWRTFVTSSS